MVLLLENGKGKEYYENGRIQFEGEYLKGRRWNGKGFDYLGNYDFEIKNGKGIGKEYNYFASLKFEGEYFNGLKNGKGKEYSDDGKLIFEGEYLNGKKISGKGYDNGNMILLLKKGKGTEYYNNGKIQFEGDYMDGKRWNGKGYDHKGNYCFKSKMEKEKEQNMIIMENLYMKVNI